MLIYSYVNATVKDWGRHRNAGYDAWRARVRVPGGCPRIDRDLKAASNLREYAAGSYAEAQNGRGESVSPSRGDVAAVLSEPSTPLRRRATAMSPVPNLALSNVAD